MKAWEGAPWEPRDWQLEALPLMVAACRSGEAGLVSAVMGAGKSVLLTELVAQAMPLVNAKGNMVLISAPTRKLVRQLKSTLVARLGPVVGQYFTEAKDLDKPVVVTCNASVPDLVDKLPRRVALWIADEAHGTEAERLKKAVGPMNPAARIGFTATPFRANESERLDLWDKVVYRYTLGDALKDKVLVPWRTVCWDGQGDAGDVDGIVLRLIRETCEGPGIVSARSIEDAEEYASYLDAHGIRAEAIHSRQGRKQQDELLERLRTGELGALVHVSLLAEGVDLPWLRWIALRRRVGSRVRLFQEFGRVLRCDKGKTGSVVIDPYDLLGTIGLSHPEAMSDDEIAARVRSVVDKEEDDFPLMELPPFNESVPPAIAVSATGVWLRSLIACLEANNEYKRETDRESGAWRKKPASTTQRARLERLKKYVCVLPKRHAKAARRVIEHKEGLTKGVAQDLLTVLLVLKERRLKDYNVRRNNHGYWPHGYRAWRWPEYPEVCELPKRVQLALPTGS